jgi:hypothetical protein
VIDPSVVNTSVMTLEVEMSLPGTVLPEARSSEEEVAAGPSNTLKKSTLSVLKEAKDTSRMPPGGPLRESVQLCELA